MSRKSGRVELSEYAGMARRVIRAYGRRFAEEGDEPELAQLAELAQELDETIATAIEHMRTRGSVPISWRRIGEITGKTGEGARKRWKR